MMTLRFGKQATAVQYLQLCLQRAGYDAKIDGIFGMGTKRAVEQLQADYHLPIDGVAGEQTWKRLTPYLKGYRDYKIKAGETLWQIAQQQKVQAKAVIEANPTVNPKNLKVGSFIHLPFDFPLVPTNVQYSAQLLADLVDGLLVRYPFLRAGSIGKTVMGRSIPYLEIGIGSKQICYNASHHANEWITTPLLLKFLEEYCQAFTTGGSIGGQSASQFFCQYRLFVVPMVNLDGVDLVCGMLKSGSFYKQARQIADRYPGIAFPSGWKANLQGVDLNLQYPAGWEQAKEIKFQQGFTTPAPRDFVGNSPLTAPESRAMYQFTTTHDFSLTLSYHSQGQLIYWKYLDFEPKNSRAIADYYAKVSGYSAEITPQASGFAGYKDWFIATYDRPGYTIEVGKGRSPLPLSQFETIYQNNLGILAGAPMGK